MNKIANLPIGIFDSGIGGLTVLKELKKKLPDESFYYLGDTARVPYGTKSPDTVIKYARTCAKFLVEKKIKLLVVACNTASALALPTLKKELDIPIIGVIEPGARSAIQKTKNNKIGVIGTESTIASNAYFIALKAINPNVEVFSKACPLFVPLVEEGLLKGEIPHLVAYWYLKTLLKKNIDTLLLGCTHYPLLIPILKKVTNYSVKLIDSAKEVAKEVAILLKTTNLMNIYTKTNIKTQKIYYYVTDNPKKFIYIGEKFLKEPIKNVEWIDII